MIYRAESLVIKPFLRSLRLLSKRHKAIFFALLVTRVAINFLDILGLAAIGLLGSMLASGLTDRPSATFLGFTVEIESSQTFFWIVIVIAGFFISKSFLGMFLLRMSSLFFARIEAKVASEIAEFLYSGTLSRLKQHSGGNVQFALTDSSNYAMSGLLMSGSSIVTEGALFLSVFAVFIFVDASTALVISFYFVLLILIFQLGINRRLRRIGQRLADSSIGVVNNIYDMTNSFREITVLSKSKFFLGHFYVFRRRYALDRALLSFLSGLPRFFVESALMVGVLALIGYQFLRGNLSEGLVTTAVFLTGGLRMMAALLPVQAAVANIKAFGPQAALAQELLVQARKWGTSQADSYEGKPVSASMGQDDHGFPVVLSNVTFTHYDSSIPSVSNVSLEIPPGSFVALVGPSGAGKSTLADLILGINEPSSGEILVSGMSPRELRKLNPGTVSYVPQQPGIVSGSVAENVALGELKNEIDESLVWDALEKAQLAEFVRNIPNGLNTEIGAQFDGLSGGQKQRLGLARALYSQPRLLVLDEATSALDAGTEASVAQTVEALAGSTTTIVIAHRLSTIRNADVVFVVENGQVIANGTFSQVRREVPLIEEYVRLMSLDQT
jgi:ATP-binding cassette subfamily C protein